MLQLNLVPDMILQGYFILKGRAAELMLKIVDSLEVLQRHLS